METEEAQMLDLLNKDFKPTIIQTFKKLRKVKYEEDISPSIKFTKETKNVKNNQVKFLELKNVTTETKKNYQIDSTIFEMAKKNQPIEI